MLQLGMRDRLRPATQLQQKHDSNDTRDNLFPACGDARAWKAPEGGLLPSFWSTGGSRPGNSGSKTRSQKSQWKQPHRHHQGSTSSSTSTEPPLAPRPPTLSTPSPSLTSGHHILIYLSHKKAVLTASKLDPTAAIECVVKAR